MPFINVIIRARIIAQKFDIIGQNNRPMR